MPKECAGSDCLALTTFEPRVTDWYEDYPENGETWQNQYRSHLRVELAALVSQATARTHCKTQAWETGNGAPLGMGDASESNGAIPGTSIGVPAHPAGSHLNGRDIDIAYYQIAQPDNRLRPVCPHHTWGDDESHCTATPTTLDVWRTAYFIGTLLESSRVRVIGVDGKVGPYVDAAMQSLCDAGWLDDASCGDARLVYESTNLGNGWFYHHHHHLHLSLKSGAPGHLVAAPSGPTCRVEGCNRQRAKRHPLRHRGR